MRLSFEFPSRFANARVQGIIEKEQTALMCGLLAIVLENLARDELNILTKELASFSAANSWPRFAPDRLLNLVALHHLNQHLIQLSRGADFSALKPIIESCSNSLLQELVEGLLSAFHDRLVTFSVTSEHITRALEKYGKRSGSSVHVSNGDITRDITREIQARMPRYVNCISTQEELIEARGKVADYRVSETKEKRVNYDLGACLMGHTKQAWEKGHWTTANSDTAFQRLVIYQERNFPNFGQRPVSQLAIRIRDYMSLQVKETSLTSKGSEKLFKDLWKLFSEDIAALFEAQGFVEESGRLKDSIDDRVLEEVLQSYRSHLSPSLNEKVGEKFVTIRDSLRNWMVMIGLPNVRIEQGDQLPNPDHIVFLNVEEAKDWYSEKKTEDWLSIDFGSVKGVALVEQIEARDATRAAQIAYRRVHNVLGRFVFHYPHGHYSNPRPSSMNILCVELSKTNKDKLWFTQATSQKAESELLLRHPNSVDEQIKVMKELSGLVSLLDLDHPLAKRIDRAIYWYNKGCWDKLSEDQLLDYWVSLEALVGLEDKDKRLIPFRAGLLAPVMTPVDGHTTYGQLRSWTKEFIEDVYQLRNEIVHGGIFEGPSFERFVDRLRSTLQRIIVVVLYPFISEMPVPESLEEVLAWIWHKNPDNQVAAPRKLS